jgi:hypothetical protein
VAAITCTIAGIVMLVVWKDQVNCSVWRLTGGGNWSLWNDDYYSDYDYCEEGKWAVVAFVSALLWFVTSGCILYFVKSGRHTKWEHKLQADADIDTDTTTAIEMGTVVQHYHHHDDHHQQQSPIALATTSAATTAVATAVVLPDIPNKIDNV